MMIEIAGEPTFLYTGSKQIDAARPSVVFIHGAGMDHSVWELQSRYFAHHGYNALCPDLPGHGASGGAPQARIEDMADWVATMLDTLGVPRALLVGHSMGALVALACGALHPERTEALALLGVSVPMPVSDALLTAARADDHRAAEMINLWGHGPRAMLGGNPVPGIWLMRTALRLLERAAPGVLYLDLSACNAYVDGERHAAQARCPALLLLGESDQMTPARRGAALADHLRDVRTERLAGCGHMMMSEQPEAVLDRLASFAAALDRAQPVGARAG